MTAAFDPYAILGVARDVPASEISRAYRAKAKSEHPDAGGSAEAFAALKRAFDLLIDPARRARFDATGDAAEEGPDTADVPALNLLRALVVDIFNSDRLHEFDLDPVRLIRAALDDKRAETLMDRAALELSMSRGRRAASKLSTTGGGALLRRMSEAWMRDLEAAIARCDRLTAQLDRALELIADAAWTGAGRAAPSSRIASGVRRAETVT